MRRAVFWQKIWPVPEELQLAKGDWGMIPLYYVRARCTLVPPCSLLSAAKAKKMETKGVPAKIQKQEAVTPKGADSTSLDISIYKFVLPLERVTVIMVINQPTISDNP